MQQFFSHLLRSEIQLVHSCTRKEIVTKRFGFNNPLFREFGAVVNNFARNTVWNAKETARQAQASSLRRLTGKSDFFGLIGPKSDREDLAIL